MPTPLLLAIGLARSFETRSSCFTIMVEQVRLEAGGVVAIVGPSGCGKSTLLGLLALALAPDEGRVLHIAGTDALALWCRGRTDDLAVLRSRTIGFVPQTSALLPFLSLRANIALPQRIVGRPDRAHIDRLAGSLGIADILDRRPAQVSVGQRQRAAIARALAHRPSIVLADEPTASVHPGQADEILRLLAAAARQSGTALMITTHDVDRAVAAGFPIAPCRADRAGNTSRFAWPCAQANQ